MLFISISFLPGTITGKLANNEPLLRNEFTILVQHMADQLKAGFLKPGKMGATMQWCCKLVAQYPQLADPGTNLAKKTVYILII